jgi:metal-responsive CopG/Arc/MetJ family transcriptional regulator
MSRTSIGQRVRINFYFDQQMLDALRQLATVKNVSYSELIRTACRDYVVREGSLIIQGAHVVKTMAETK